MGSQCGLGGSPHSRSGVVSPTRALHQDTVTVQWYGGGIPVSLGQD
ncbi:MAG: hypothetical protein F6K55_33005 [Moorea sp. SIO4A3]|nr:hypothetical protein [Moorena sp. SIO4A3]